MEKIREFLPAAALLLFSVGWAGALMAWPRDGQPVAVLYGAAVGESALIRTANAGADAILGFGALPGIVVAQSAQPTFIENLYENGALVVVRAPANADCMR